MSTITLTTDNIIAIVAVIVASISIITNVVLGIFAYKNGKASYQLSKQKMDLEASLDHIKKFDQPTAMSILQKARWHEHNTWNFKNSFEKLVQTHRDDDECLRLFYEIGRLHGEADSIVTDMIHVYRLSGATISEQVVDQWVKDGFIPDHYKARFLSHIR